MSFLEKAVEISTQPENCEGDNWTDLINLCGEADTKIAGLKDTIHYYKTMQECCSSYIKEHTD